ncbi:hypothetical protein Pla110_12760 [Polystyrenella longa]|uniref:Uncharacterized protein n=1 Tax=Polystyrenella longa TaxID=2528007 RepID=A0A518CK12_9PLAN|nr:hypothetical protein Pla110_12760 [Polystyrenella longa]
MLNPASPVYQSSDQQSKKEQFMILACGMGSPWILVFYYGRMLAPVLGACLMISPFVLLLWNACKQN